MPPRKKKSEPSPAEAAATAVRAGSLEPGSTKLLELSAAGDPLAAIAAAELLAYQGRLETSFEHALRFLAAPSVVPSGNAFVDVCRLVRWLAAETGDSEMTNRASEVIPPSHAPIRDRVLIQGVLDPSAVGGGADRAGFEEAVRTSNTARRFRDKPGELARHQFALAVAFGLDDEIAARFRVDAPEFGWDQVIWASRSMARLGNPEGAWEVILRRLPDWLPMARTSIAPLILLHDPWLGRLMSPTRCSWVLSTPRGPGAV